MNLKELFAPFILEGDEASRVWTEAFMGKNQPNDFVVASVPNVSGILIKNRELLSRYASVTRHSQIIFWRAVENAVRNEKTELVLHVKWSKNNHRTIKICRVVDPLQDHSSNGQIFSMKLE